MPRKISLEEFSDILARENNGELPDLGRLNIGDLRAKFGLVFERDENNELNITQL